MVYTYQTLEVVQRTSILEVTINNPPVNVMTLQLYSDLVEFTEQVEQDELHREKEEAEEERGRPVVLARRDHHEVDPPEG